MAVNTSSNALNQLAAGLAEKGLLSTYVRPYANMDRAWERRLAGLPGVGKAYARSVGRRKMPKPLGPAHLREAGVLADFAMAAHGRLPVTTPGYRKLRESLMFAVTNAVARDGAKAFTGERAVVASWSCAEPAFRKAKASGAVCVLNYPFAHHRAARRYLLEETELQPAFADTIDNQEWPAWYGQRLDREIELADHILVGSTFVRDSFVTEGVPEEKLVVLPYGTDTALFEPGEPDDRHRDHLRLLFVGQLTQRKGISYLLEAVRQLPAPGVSLTLVGPPRGNGAALAPYREIFRHIPHVPRADLREIYHQADAFVFPTLVEGMPLVILEAMASGLPVVTTPHGPGDIVRDGVDGFLTPARDVDAIVEALNRLRTDPELRAEMGRNARQRALEYSWRAYREKALTHLLSWIDQPRDEPRLRAEQS